MRRCILTGPIQPYSLRSMTSSKTEYIALENVDYLCFILYNPKELSIPLNDAVVTPERVRLNCSTQEDDNAYWFRNAPENDDDTLIYHKKLIRDDWFTVDDSVPGRADLKFSSAERASGRYGCGSFYATHTAEVVVVGKYLYVHFCVVGLLGNVI